MSVQTAHLIKWPDRETLRKTLPTSFRRFFKKCCVIIDCSEAFVERLSNLLARAQVWSNYKHHSTLKFLIGITPQGTVSYISPCAGGRMLDKEIVEQSNLIDFLLPGDVVIVDRGFTCNNYARRALAEVKTPPFTREKNNWRSSRLIGVENCPLFASMLSVSLVCSSKSIQFSREYFH